MGAMGAQPTVGPFANPALQATRRDVADSGSEPDAGNKTEQGSTMVELIGQSNGAEEEAEPQKTGTDLVGPS